MATFKIKAGQHIQADPDWKPSEEEKQRAKDSGVPARHPSRKYTKGQVVESDLDLVQLFGSEKFELLSGSKSKAGAEAEAPPFNNQAQFPGGQVSSGYQAASGSKEGTVEGAMTPEQIEEVEKRRAAGAVTGVGERGVGYDAGKEKRSGGAEAEKKALPKGPAHPHAQR